MGDISATSLPHDSIVIAIDRGGTFTDVWSSVEGQPDHVFKLLSVDPDHYQDAPTEGVYIKTVVVRMLINHENC